MNGIPEDIVEIINSIIAYKEKLKKEQVEKYDEHLERAYIYDYTDEKEEEKSYKIEIEF